MLDECHGFPFEVFLPLKIRSFPPRMYVVAQAYRCVQVLKDIVTAMTEADSKIYPPPGAVASISDASPVHYIVKIKLFSLLAKTEVEKYESGVFEAGGYKWNLVLYPSGNKSKNVKEHISLYLAMADTSSLPLGWEIHVIFRLFLLDQNKDSYLVIQDVAGKERRFHGLKLEWGFDEFIQLSTFNDSRYGFLVEDTCVLGAELDEKRQESQIFKFTDKIRWKILLYPKGKDSRMGTHLSLYLALDLETLPAGFRLYVDYTLRIVDQVKDRKLDLSAKAKHWFGASSLESGWTRYVSLDSIYQSNHAYVIQDICIIEAEVIVLGIVMREWATHVPYAWSHSSGSPLELAVTKRFAPPALLAFALYAMTTVASLARFSPLVFDPRVYHPSEGQVGSYWFHEGTQACFDDFNQYKMMKAMCGLSCTACEYENAGGSKDCREERLMVTRLIEEVFWGRPICDFCGEQFNGNNDRNATTLHSGQNAVVPRSSQVLSSVGHRPGLSANSPSYAWCRSSHDRGAVSRYQVSALSRPAVSKKPSLASNASLMHTKLSGPNVSSSSTTGSSSAPNVTGKGAVENSSCPPMAALLKRKFPSSSPSLCPDSTKQNELLATYNVSSPRNCSDEKRTKTIFHDPRRASKEKFPVDADQKSIHRKQYGSAVRLQLSTTSLVKTFHADSKTIHLTVRVYSIDISSVMVW
ncbi:hypothetical protein OIU76_013607 [Salix suchowensis]|nr:hypothetical protein OIU76_013607 [Salix suchowensis]